MPILKKQKVRRKCISQIFWIPYIRRSLFGVWSPALTPGSDRFSTCRVSLRFAWGLRESEASACSGSAGASRHLRFAKGFASHLGNPHRVQLSNSREAVRARLRRGMASQERGNFLAEGVQVRLACSNKPGQGILPTITLDPEKSAKWRAFYPIFYPEKFSPYATA